MVRVACPGGATSKVAPKFSGSQGKNDAGGGKQSGCQHRQPNLSPCLPAAGLKDIGGIN